MSPVERTVEFFETLTIERVARLDELYAPNAYFKDPFNEVSGLEPIRRIFEHMFEQVHAPRFRITDRVLDDHSAMLAWDFTFRLRRRELRVRGVTHLRFDAQGRIAYHRDYWDAAEELYAKLPLLGPLMRLLSRRLSAGG